MVMAMTRMRRLAPGGVLNPLLILPTPTSSGGDNEWHWGTESEEEEEEEDEEWIEEAMDAERRWREGSDSSIHD